MAFDSRGACTACSKIHLRTWEALLRWLMRAEAPYLDQLPDDALLQVLVCLELEDLLHLSRTAARLRTLVATRAGPAWKALYLRNFQDDRAPPAGRTWANHYRDRCTQTAAARPLELFCMPSHGRVARPAAGMCKRRMVTG